MVENLSSNNQKGFSLIEIVLVIAIALILTFIIFSALGSYRRREALRNTPTAVRSILEEARSLTLSSRTDEVYGVRVETNRVVRFKGTTYSASDPNNKPFIIDSTATISAITLNGGGSDIVFQKRTGQTDQYGIITIELVSDATQTRTVTIHETGLIE
jgi:prepilin-type N-terminal cleavage/methylation domain-containing protein